MMIMVSKKKGYSKKQTPYVSLTYMYYIMVLSFVSRVTVVSFEA